VVRKALTRYKITLDYKLAEPLSAWLTAQVNSVVSTDYGVAVTITVLVASDNDDFIPDLTSKTNGQAVVTKLDEEFAEVPYLPEK
ncbi:MAG TPA: hypothetical protein DCW31_12045, partial [Lactobacillus sp.]|nr:hypothetical protein [Lactobacillus sp.]